MNALRISLLVAFLAATSLVHAQQTVTVVKGHELKHEKRARIQPTDGYVFMKGGTMLALQGGSVVALTAPTTMSDGTKVSPDGSVTQPNGTQLMLHNGQYVLQDGRVVDEGQLKGIRKE